MYTLREIFTHSNAQIVYYKNTGEPLHTDTMLLGSKASALALQLTRDFQINSKDRVLISYDNSLELIISLMALAQIGAVAVPINPMESLRAKSFIYSDSGAKLLLGKEKELLSLDFTFDSLAIDSNHSEFAVVSPDDLAVMFYTSGTTGTSKGVPLTHAQLYVNLKATIEHLELTGEKTHLCVMPMFHVNAFNFSLLTSIFVGNKLVICEKFNPLRYFSIAREHEVRVLSFSPSIVKLLNALPLGTCEGVEFAVCASAPLEKRSALDFYHKYNIPILQGYGLSESVNFTCLNIPSEKAITLTQFKGDELSIGRCLPGQEIIIWNSETNTQCAEDEVGEVLIRGSNVMNGYWKGAQEHQHPDVLGFLRSGDLGLYKTLSGVKYYFLRGRIKEVVKRNGEGISPIEVDNEILHFNLGLDLAVVGFPHYMSGEELGIVIERGSHGSLGFEIRLQALRRLLQTIPFFKRPKTIVVVHFLSRTPTGKVQRNKMKQLFKFYQEADFNES